MKIIKYLCFILVLGCMGRVVSAQTKPDALKMYQNGDYTGAIQVCEAEIAETPNSVDSYAVLCWSLLRNKQYAEAEQRAADGLALGTNDVRLLESLGEAKYYLGKNKEAMSQFEKYLSTISDDGSRVGVAYYYIGEIYIRQGRYQHADIALSAAVKKEPLLDRWWTRLGYAREMAKNYKEAVAAYDQALKLNPSQTDASLGKTRASAHLQ